MRDNIWNIILYALIFILQVLVNNYVDVGAYVYICFIPLLIFGIPMKTNINITMIAAFCIGLLLDLFSNGILGLNAASATMLAAFRAPLFRNTVNRDKRLSIDVPSVRNMGLNRYLVYTTLGTLIYLTTYTLLDGASARPFLFIVFRILISLVIDVAIITLISNSTIDRD